jgi:hypothetical protein
MGEGKIVVLEERGIVRVAGENARDWLDNLLTNDVPEHGENGACFAALLAPQGKILFEFFVVASASGYLLEVLREKAGELVKRLSMYKLRAKIEIADVSDRYKVAACWGLDRGQSWGFVHFDDPRSAALCARQFIPIEAWPRQLKYFEDHPDDWRLLDTAAYHQRRVDKAIPEGGRDYPLGDTFPHEANYDLVHGVDFAKGCFVGQEVVARMQHKTVVRKRVARVNSAIPLATGAEVRIGDATIGSVGTTAGNAALALLRLDRVAEALDKGQPITAGGAPIEVDKAMLDRYRAAATQRKAAQP